MFGLDDHTDSLGGQPVSQPVGDLFGQPFLYLEVAGEQLDHPGQFRQSQNALTGQVTDVRHAVERQQVVLAQ